MPTERAWIQIRSSIIKIRWESNPQVRFLQLPLQAVEVVEGVAVERDVDGLGGLEMTLVCFS